MPDLRRQLVRCELHAQAYNLGRCPSRSKARCWPRNCREA